MGVRIGIDAGGTFTDFALVDERGNLTEAKTPTRAHRPVEAIDAGLRELARLQEGKSLSELMRDCDLVVLGTTTGTNALIQHKGAVTGLICTHGFRDYLRMRLGYKEERYDFWHPPPHLLVPRYLTCTVRERVLPDGTVRSPLEEHDVEAAIQKFRDEGVDAIGVCLLWSFLNPNHERRVGELIAEALPDVYLALSVDLLPEMRYYDRTSTTVVNAYLGPLIRQYVSDVEGYLARIGFTGQVRYLQANGGICSAETLIKEAVGALNSGPAAGPVAGSFWASQVGHRDVITVDMGGTSFDAALVRESRPVMTKSIDVCRYRIGIPMLDIHTVGAGGGSIAWVDEGILRVGPQSAEAEPGPACYQRGGTDATVTDADLVLGYLNPDRLLAGKMKISRAAAEAVIEEKIAKPLGLSIPEAALAINSIVNQNMTRAIGEISLERGNDPRDFALVVAGGAGPVHAARLAQELGIRSVVIPRISSTFCAFGAITSDLRHDYGISFPSRLQELDPEEFTNLLISLEERAEADLVSEGVSRSGIKLYRSAEIRYVDEIYETTVPIPGGALNRAKLQSVMGAFHRRHQELYGHSQVDGLVELTQVAVSGIGQVTKPQIEINNRQGLEEVQPASYRDVWFEEYPQAIQTAVFDTIQLKAGGLIKGPGIVEMENTTIVVAPNSKLELIHADLYLLTMQ